MWFADEASLSNTATISYAWSEKGQQPIVLQKQAKRERKTLLGAINPLTGVVQCRVKEKGSTQTFFSLFMKLVLQNTKQKVVVVVDNVRYHHAKRLKPILARYAHRIELLYLPPYSPDLNPIERFWCLCEKKSLTTDF